MSTAEDLALHLRLVAGDPLASSECVVRWLPSLVRRLSTAFSWLAARDEQFVMEAALEALMDYTMNPTKYDPGRASLGSYLFMAAKNDLKNALRRDLKQSRGASSIHLVEESLAGGNVNFEERAIARADAQVAWELVKGELTVPLDRRLLSLMLQGERTTEAYGEVLAILHLPEQEQKHIVKRHKDRISRRLERLGEKILGQRHGHEPRRGV